MAMSETDIRALLGRLAQGDETALRRLQAEFGRRIYAFALNRLRDPDEAETVVVDTLWEVWKAPDRFRGESLFSTWLLGIARNKVLMTLRGRGPWHDEYEEEIHGDLQADETPGQYERIDLAQRAARVRECMETLSAPQREALRLVFFEDMSVAEVAAIQGCPEGTVKTRLFHARRNLRDCLRDLDEGAGR